MEELRQVNDALFFAINNGWHSAFNDLWIGNATYLGNGWVSYVLALLGLVLIDRRHFKRNFLLLLIATIVELILIQSVKSILDLPRPLTVFDAGIKNGSVIINVMFEPLYWKSFPSGHTQTAFCIAAVLSWAASKSTMAVPMKQGVLIVAFALAVLVGISRMYVGAHFPIDVLGGIIFGLVPVWLIAKYMKRFNGNIVEADAKVPSGATGSK
jgi:undecaprenyl-diphosphatase